MGWAGQNSYTGDAWRHTKPTLEGLQRQVFELQIEQIKKDIDDHEKKVTPCRRISNKIQFHKVYSTMGGGLFRVLSTY